MHTYSHAQTSHTHAQTSYTDTHTHPSQLRLQSLEVTLIPKSDGPPKLHSGRAPPKDGFSKLCSRALRAILGSPPNPEG